MTKVAPAVSSTANIISVLEDEILNGTLAPEDRLDEQGLARRFNVSRTPIREALRHLASSGLVDIKPNQGTTVRRLTTSDLIEMFQVFGELCGLGAQLGARRLSSAEIDKLRALNQVCADAAEEDDADKFFRANLEFHDFLDARSKNNYLLSEIHKMSKHLNAYRRFITLQPRRMMRSVEEHNQIIDAIGKGDEEAAHILMRKHVNLLAGSATDVLIALENKHGPSDG
ncbi:GntR family transcriptional regulator [Pararhodobacter oceanensis]|nr:GntR family transcriptional regulator [Pararhodobacter oceanensis]